MWRVPFRELNIVTMRFIFAYPPFYNLSLNASAILLIMALDDASFFSFKSGVAMGRHSDDLELFSSLELNA